MRGVFHHEYQLQPIPGRMNVRRRFVGLSRNANVEPLHPNARTGSPGTFKKTNAPDGRPPAKKRRTSPSRVDTNRESPSDVNHDPIASDDDDSAGDIPSSFDKNGRSLGFSRKSSPRLAGSKRLKEASHLDGSNDARPQNKLRHAPSLELSIFGEFERPKKTKDMRKPQARTYGKPLTSALVKLSDGKPDDDKKRTSRALKMPKPFLEQLPTPKSSNTQSSPSQQSEGAYEGAQDLVDLSEHEDISTLPTRRRSRKEHLKADNEPVSSQESRKFKAVPTLTQAINDIDPEELRKEQEKLDKEEQRRKELAARVPDQGDCPMRCGKMLPRSLLDTLSLTASFKEQRRFCQRHQIEDARLAWKTRKYPNIDWDDFSNRLESHDRTVKRFFENADRLHFRRLMADRLKSGKSRNLLQQLKNDELGNLGVGYYGTKGHDLITNHISKAFAGELRSRAASDNVMSAQGAMAYVQEVLVPELATVLIKEDLNVNEGEARRVMRESTEIGDLLHPSDGRGSKNRREPHYV